MASSHLVLENEENAIIKIPYCMKKSAGFKNFETD